MNRAASLLVLLSLLGGCARCGGSDPGSGSSGVAAKPPAGLSPEEAKKVLATVGDRTITLGDYAGVLERLGPYERMRYQAPERRKELLDEMITVEVLAAEAVAQGYDKDPLTQLEIQNALRDALLADLRKDAPKPEAVPADQVRVWYDEHRDIFRDPERRRVAAIATKTRAQAEAVLAALGKEPTPLAFGQQVRDKSVLEDAKADVPLDLAGDLGIVSPPGDSRGINKRVPESVREAAYKLAKVGDLAAEPIADGDRFYVVRLVQVLEARDRTFEEAERSIRVRLAQDLLAKKEDELVAELQKKIPVVIDEAVLVGVRSAPQGDAGTP